ncbi:MAG: acyl-[acyl-carrier-protein] desaturase [Frankiales bacterium]|nr:acyl-[acyl-carrier-protein] desaturase [Frankiales bacterium]
MTAPHLEDRQLLVELEPVVARQLDRHLSVTKDWMPHEYVPWSLGRDFDGDPYDVSQSRLSSPARVAMEVNLLTEDNLPSYHREIASMFGRDGAWGTWVHRWTAEEGRHAFVIRDYLLVTRGVDPDELERQRMATMQVGYEPVDDRGMLHGIAYVSMQELATRISHRNTGKATDDPVADRLLQRIAADENLHMIFYRDLVGAAMELAPSQTIPAIVDEVLGFQMPGFGITDFGRKAAIIAKAGIYDLRIHHDEVVQPMMRQWRVFEREGLDPAAEKARDTLAQFLVELDAQASRQEEIRARANARRDAAQL